METTNFKIGYDPEYERVLFTFADRTFSYSPKIDGWISEHDYLPNMYFNNRNQMFSSKDNKIYTHNTGQRGNFYDAVFDTIYEYVDNRSPELSKVATGLWIDSEIYDTNGNIELDKTIDAFQIFNNYQDTLNIDVTYFAQDEDNPYIGNARRTKNKWFINQFRDKMNIPDGISETLEWMYERRMEDHYQQVKLIKHNTLDEKFILFRTNLIFKESIR